MPFLGVADAEANERKEKEITSALEVAIAACAFKKEDFDYKFKADRNGKRVNAARKLLHWLRRLPGDTAKELAGQVHQRCAKDFALAENGGFFERDARGRV